MPAAKPRLTAMAGDDVTVEHLLELFGALSVEDQARFFEAVRRRIDPMSQAHCWDDLDDEHVDRAYEP
jgi:hypothetical protein